MAKIPALSLSFCCMILVATLAPAQESPAGPNRCSSEINSCGCTITRTGTYTVGSDLNASQSNAPNCIEITADHSILNLKGHTMTGNGDGNGIWIHRSADHVVIQGADEGTYFRTPDDDPCAPDNHQAVINGWNVAIEDDADYAVIQLFKSIGGNLDDPSGNATAGIEMNGVTGSMAADFDACYNGTGVLIRNSSGASLYNSTSDFNQTSGVWLNSSTGSSISTSSLNNNGSYGIWLLISSNNAVSNYGATGNGNTGTLIGCGDRHCTGNETSDNNRISNGGNTNNGVAGIMIQKHNDNNMITVTGNSGNPNGYDMVDENNKCGNDVWYNNNGTTQQSCIH